MTLIKTITISTIMAAACFAQAAEIKWCRYHPTQKQISGFCYSSPAECEKAKDGYEACVQVTK